MSAPTATASTTRNATLDDLAELLKDQSARAVDFVAPASAIRAVGGALVVKGTEAALTEDGVTITDGTYVPTQVADGQIAEKLGIPNRFLSGLRADRAWMYDQNVNGMLHGKTIRRGDTAEVITPADSRSFMLRTLRGDDGQPGVLRALLSDRYGIIDNLDILTAVLKAIYETGAQVEVHSTDLTDRKMTVRLHAPGIAAMAPTLLAGYRSPFADPEVDAQRRHAWNPTTGYGYGYEPGTEPVLFAGIRISNSEVGDGRFSITPELRVKICSNGLVINEDMMAKTHLGGRLETGLISWGEDTQKANLDLIVKQTRDAVQSFLNPTYLAKTVNRIEAAAGAPIGDAPAEAVQRLGKSLKFSQTEIDGVLGHFTRGGQMTRGGVLNAITSFSQTVADADRADELDRAALQVLTLA